MKVKELIEELSKYNPNERSKVYITMKRSTSMKLWIKRLQHFILRYS